MRRCQQVQGRSLESELLSAPAHWMQRSIGRSLRASSHASASQSMLLLQKLPRPLQRHRDGAFREDLYAGARYKLSLQEQHQQEQRRQQAQRRQKLQPASKMQDSFMAAERYFEAHVGHASHEENPDMEDSMVAVPTYADVSHHVKLLTTQQAHCKRP
ncbi:hypothetical protein PPTG_14965 [Phytophthora nicotianae INRA-310]|uniref:Uncharacterized protein n=1 Tax=Phytophthora nicotianae (strain INRA-310) TaxID=761204 RepID=W2PVM3_PHYN3|nr:hypothetical protein PPTG_14965 [Phytophthora nicotianae INRA-310]ETN04264.1 hypothetical protein PPTG_14965 [Phytophthora nicotianae INRA-310]